MSDLTALEQRVRYEVVVRAALAARDFDLATRCLGSAAFLADSLRLLGPGAVFTLADQHGHLEAACPERYTAALRAWGDILRGCAHRIARGGDVSLLQLAASFARDESVRRCAAVRLEGRVPGGAWLRAAGSEAAAGGARRTFDWPDGAVVSLTTAGGGRRGVASAFVITEEGGNGRASKTQAFLRVWSLTGEEAAREIPTGDARNTVVRALADGATVLTGSSEGVVRGFDLRAAGHERQLFVERAHEAPVCAIVPLPDGVRFVSVSEDGAIVAWSLDPWERTAWAAPSGGTSRKLRDAALAAGLGRLVTLSHDGQLDAWDVDAGRLVHTVATSLRRPSVLLAAPRDRALIVASDRQVAWVDPDTGATRVIEGAPGVRDRARIAVHPEGRALYVTRGAGVDAVDLGTGERLPKAVPASCFVEAFGLAQDGASLLTADAESGSIKLWDLSHAPEGSEAGDHDRAVFAVAIHTPWRSVLTGSLDGRVRAWALEDASPLPLTLSLRAGVFAVHARALDGGVVTVTQDGTVTVFGRDREVASTFALNEYGEVRSALAMCGTLLVTGGGYIVDDRPLSMPTNVHPIRVWSLPDGTLTRWLEGHADEVTAITAHPDESKVVSVAADRTLAAWSLLDGTCTRVLSLDRVARAVAVHPDGDRVLVGGQALAVWSLSSGRRMCVLGGHHGLIEGVAWSPSGDRALSLARDRQARVWDLRSGAPLARWDAERPLRSGAFVTEDRVVLGDEGGGVTFLDLVR